MAGSVIKINIKKLVATIRKTNVYTPIIEAVVNSIDAIRDSGNDNGNIIITLYRTPQEALQFGNQDENETPPVNSIRISDNGIGFDSKNLDSFEYIYTENKASRGGKGFGRFVYLKYFKQAKISSVFSESDKKHKRTFDFVKADAFTTNKHVEVVEGSAETGTEIILDSINDEGLRRLDKKLETISRKILENLLVFFTLDTFKCPRITVVDDFSKESIVLNDLINDPNGISEILNKNFVVESSVDGKDVKEEFRAKVFKVYYGESRSSINLVADQRQVTETSLHEYIPEFKDEFYDKVTNAKNEIVNKNYTIKAYVSGKYLDQNISETRDSFIFPKNETGLFQGIAQKDIERHASLIAREAVSEEVTLRQEKKKVRVQEYVNTSAPYHRSYVSYLDYSSLPFDCSNDDIEAALQKTKFQIETKTKKTIKSIVENNKAPSIDEQFTETLASLTTLGESELSHYVVLRKSVLDLFKKSLAWNDNQKYNKEKVVHDIIFPTRKDSDSIPYDQHNLWLVDEKLCFHEYLASDKPLNSNDERPDILIFDTELPLRSGDELGNPIVVVEFKKPQREDYEEKDNPLKQISGYIAKIRDGKFKTSKGKTLNVNENTPAFGYLVADLTPKIREFCREYDLTLSPDNQGYFGFHRSHKIYFEVVSFDKLVKDAEQRNRVFFKKLHLE